MVFVWGMAMNTVIINVIVFLSERFLYQVAVFVAFH